MKMTRYTIQISLDVPDTFTEVIPDDVESMEVAVEGGISLILAELFGGTILVEKVLIHSLELMQTPVH